MKSPAHVTVSGAPDGFDAQVLLDEYETSGTVLYVARDDKRASAIADALARFAPDLSLIHI